MAFAGHKAETKLREITECSICMSTFTDPRMLPCIHTFCFECLRKTADAEQKKKGDKMSCPLCRKEFIVPPEGIIGLQKNFFMENLLEFKTAMHSNLPTLRIGTETKEKVKKEEVKRMSNVKYCNQHNQKPLEYYCADCKAVVCVSCFVENHRLHDCKDVATVEENVRKTINRAAWKASIFADEVLSLRKKSEMTKTDFLKKLQEMETRIIKGNQDLKNVIDEHTNSLLDELTAIKSRNLKDMENQFEEINRCYTILRSFEFYCTEIVLKGSASDICSSVDQLIASAAELDNDHETLLGRPCQSIEISVQMRDVLQEANRNLIGRVEARVKTKVQSENYAVAVISKNEIIKVNLHRPNDISSVENIPSTVAFNPVAAVYCNTMFVTGVGDNSDEIWKYSEASGWIKCASMLQRRRCHSAVFIDEVLYIFGGCNNSSSLDALDGVEAYNAVTDKCTVVGKLVHSILGFGNYVPIKSSLYIFGDTFEKKFHHVQVYNTKENKCSVLSRPMPRPFHGMRAVLWDTSVILLGADTCFIFNIETEVWQERKQIKTNIPFFGFVVEDEKVFVIGGLRGRRQVRCIPLQNILNNKAIEWKIHATLPESPHQINDCFKMRFLV